MSLARIEAGISRIDELMTRRHVAGPALALLVAVRATDDVDAKRKKKKKKNKKNKKSGAQAGANVEICHKGQTIQVPQSDVDGHLAHGDSRGRCPEPRCPGFPGYTPDPATVAGPTCAGDGAASFGYSIRRAAQPFVAQSTGGVVSAELTLYNNIANQIVPGTVYTLDIREVDQGGKPTTTVLGSTDVTVSANPSNPYVLFGTFDCPVAVTQGVTYAFAITTALASNMALVVGNHSCPEQFYTDKNADGNFGQAGTLDLLFKTRMVA